MTFAKQVLGPAAGPAEVIKRIREPYDRDPRDEYIVGVLAPRNAPQPQDDPDAESELTGDASEEEDDDADPVAFVSSALAISPALNPKSLPSSLGISFLLRGQSPQLRICATWARYVPKDGNYVRTPRSWVSDAVTLQDNARWSIESGGPDVQIVLRAIPIAPGVQRISVFLLNIADVPKGEKRPRAQDLVFQPEIRISLEPGSILMPFDPAGEKSEDPEEESLELLYRERKAFARGHLCSAIWAEVDPQRPPAGAEPLPAVPFAWTDAEAIPQAMRLRFVHPDLRTEYLPMVNIEAPEAGWDSRWGPEPTLTAEILAESFPERALEEAIVPLLEGYARWIGTLRAALGGLGTHANAARRHLAEAEENLQRMRNGLEILRTDSDARLVFCFMNKAMDLQARWRDAISKKGTGKAASGLTWRPFQLAFVLQAIEGVANPLHEDRRKLDLLWFPTGGGKTEAYLALAAFALALRRRRGRDAPHHGGGVGVLSRYTLRLLTIQQFRRALAVITAMDYLRIEAAGPSYGWRPRGFASKEMHLWGPARFSAGLWVGQSVTPNRLESLKFKTEEGRLEEIVGALGILNGERGEGEPAQVLNCPACGHDLAIPEKGLPPGTEATIDLAITTSGSPSGVNLAALSVPFLTVNSASISPPSTTGVRSVSISFATKDTVRAKDVDNWIKVQLQPAIGSTYQLLCVRPSRSGYFYRSYANQQGNGKPSDFEIICVNHACELAARRWFEMVPQPTLQPEASGLLTHVEILAAFQSSKPGFMAGMPLSAYCVDDQVYHRCPSLVIATVDKFARLSFEPKGASLFGNVEAFHARHGYYRPRIPPTYTPGAELVYHPPGYARGVPLHTRAAPFLPPDLVIQDELHLIEGPLGSMVGLYETVIEELATRTLDGKRVGPKYVASTATIRQARSQVQSLYARPLRQFPANGLTIDDSFFMRTKPAHARSDVRAGRLYLGFAAPGRGGQTPVVRAWSTLLQRVGELRAAGAPTEVLDNFWTLVGYFNAIRELAGVAGLNRQDIPQRIGTLASERGAVPRDVAEPIELSSRGDSQELPALLQKLAVALPNAAADAVLATSMFGTGVDIDRLGLMMVHGQPKTTSAYIQSTGRVGRRRGGLVVGFLRAGRPRDLDHYEFFVGYHRAIHRHVEPITVAPFSPRARERGLGPLAVALLRNAREIQGAAVSPDWAVEQRLEGGRMWSNAHRMAAHHSAPEIKSILALLEHRAQAQEAARRPPTNVTLLELQGDLDRWRSIAAASGTTNDPVYFEAGMAKRPTRRVILGDPLHADLGLDVAYRNAPSSLRDVESTTRFKG